MSGIKIPAGALPPERVHFSLPLSKEKRENVELSVAKALATGRAVGGGIFLTSKDSKFAYIRSEGDTEVPLDVQVPLLKSHDRDLGLQRNQTHSIYFVKANAATFARLFVRVLHGCRDDQIQATVQYLNDCLPPGVTTFPGLFDKYEELVPLCRDILHPEYRYFTRRNRMKPYMWVPLCELEPNIVVTLGDMVHNASYSKPVKANCAHGIGRWPEITLVRRTDTGTVHELSELSKVVPEDAILPYHNQQQSDECVQVDCSDVADEPKSKDTNEINVVDENSNNPRPVTEPADKDEIVMNTEARSSAQLEAGDDDELPPYSGDDDDADNGKPNNEAGSASDKNEFHHENEGSFEVLEDDDEVFVTSDNGDDATKQTNNRKSNDNQVVVNDETADQEKDNEAEQILSGNINVPGVAPVTVRDSRPVKLRRLHEALPRNKEAIPDGMKKKLAFSMLILNIRSLELEYNEEMGIDGDLPVLDEGKTLNQREVKRELKHLLELMCDRDQWISEHRVSQTRALFDTRKKKNTKSGRKLEAEKFEAVERQRLIEKSRMDKTVEFDVEHGPLAAGLAGLPMHLRQKKQLQEYNTVKKMQDRHRRSLGRTESTASSTGSGKPLTAVLTKQSKKKRSHRNKDRHEARDEAPLAAFKEINPEEATGKSSTAVGAMSNDQSVDFQGSFMNGTITKDESVFAKPEIPRGYVKANTLKLMMETYKKTTDLVKTTNDTFTAIKSQIQTLSRKQSDNSKLLERHCQTIKNLQLAFFDYDMMAHHELCDVESAFLAYLPLDELGERTDFVFTDPACAKTISKHIISELKRDGYAVPTLTQLVNKSAKLCFSPGLIAHMHIVKRQWKDNVGWWKVRCPTSFQNMLEKYILSRHRVVNESLVENGKGWRQILYSFFKNSGETYFNFKCKSSKSQSEYVQKRRQIRIELQRKHYNADIEGRDLKIATIEEEMERYSRHSENFEDAKDLQDSSQEQSQRRPLNNPDDKKVIEPLPSIPTLKEMSKRLQEAISASVSGQKEKKKDVVDDVAQNEATPTSSSGSVQVPVVSMEVMGGQTKSVSSSKRRKRRREESSSSDSSSSSSTGSGSSNTSSSQSSSSSSSSEDDDFLDESVFRREIDQKRPRTGAANRAGAVTSTQVASLPMGKPRSFAKFHSVPTKVKKVSGRGKKSRK